MQSNGSRATYLNRRSFLAAGGGALGALALATSTWALPPRTNESGRRRPNIVMVLADDLGYGELGSYGQELIETPVLDRLAAEGVRYTDFYSGAPVCAPSRCSLMTGLHSGHSTVRNNPDPGQEDTQFRDDEVTFSLLLQSFGYRTAMFGKWGFSTDTADTTSHPNDHGFDEFYGYLTHIHAHQYYPSYLWDNRERVDVPAGSYAPDLFTERSLEFMEANRDDPFLLMLTTNIPHSPQQVPEQGAYAGQGWNEGDVNHAAQVTRLDGDVGRIVDKLDELGITEDTVFVFLSDNGPHEEGAPSFNPDFFDANGPLTGYKRNLLEGGIRTPAIVWAPGRMGSRAGTEVSQPLAFWDWLPTLADLAGAPVPDFIDGRSIRHTFDDAAPARSRSHPRPQADRSLYWWRVDPYGSQRANAAEGGPTTRAAEALRQGEWKALRIAPGKDRTVADSAWDFRLYNLRTDIGETTNLAAQQPEVAAALLALIKESWSDPTIPLPTWSPDGLTAEAPGTVAPGAAFRVDVALANHLENPFTRVEVGLDLPEGWTASGPRRDRGSIRPGESRTWTFDVVAGAAVGRQELVATARYRNRAETREVSRRFDVLVEAGIPATTSYLSDMEWRSADNAWGPVERDMSNGRDGAGDGPPISIAGVPYEKGLGVHAPSRIVYELGGGHDRFTAVVGIDDFSANQGSNGSVVFQLWADGAQVYDSGTVTVATGAVPVEVDITAVDVLELVVTDGGNGNTHDHSSWADAMVHAD